MSVVKPFIQLPVQEIFLMIHRLLWGVTGGVWVAIASGSMQVVKAESMNIIFSGTVPHTCTLDASAYDPSDATVPSSMMGSENQLDVACNDETHVQDGQWTQSPEGRSAPAQAWANQADLSDEMADDYRTIVPQ